MYAKVLKRILDIVLATAGLVILVIPMLLLAVIVKLDSPGPALFRQKRIGAGGTTFEMLKFRSMPVDVPHDLPTHLFRAEDMLTPWQKLLRKSSLDELPQMFNILRGEMSIVGPRPALWNQEDLLAEREKYGANAVKPGLTGWAQINGRDELSIEEKARYDGEYAAAMTAGGGAALRMDLRCFFGTIGKVLRREDVHEGGPEAERQEASKR